MTKTKKTARKPAAKAEKNAEPTPYQIKLIDGLLSEVERAASKRPNFARLVRGYGLFVDRRACVCAKTSHCFVCRYGACILPGGCFTYPAITDRQAASEGKIAWPGQPVLMIGPKLRGDERLRVLAHAIAYWRLRDAFGAFRGDSDTPTAPTPELLRIARRRILAMAGVRGAR